MGDEFRLLICDGEMLPKSDLERCEMPYFFWRPNSGIERCIEGWARNGGTHHEVINIGSVAKRWKMLAGYLGVRMRGDIRRREIFKSSRSICKHYPGTVDSEAGKT